MDAARAIREADSKCEYGMITVGEYERLIAPYRDVEPVVRCKDCKHFGRYYGDSKNGVCEKLNIIGRSEEWFCADGERKE